MRSAEGRWARKMVKGLAIPPGAGLDDMIGFLARWVGRPLKVVEVDAPVLNGALEDGGDGALWIRVSSAADGIHRQHLVCRGLARALYGEPGARDGHLDYTTPIEREIEQTATELAMRLHASRPGGVFCAG